MKNKPNSLACLTFCSTVYEVHVLINCCLNILVRVVVWCGWKFKHQTSLFYTTG